MPRTEAPRWTVLVVDDDAGVREYAVSVLDEAGYRILTAADGESALTIIERDPSVDILFTDVVMPGMNGFELARAATALRPDLRVLFTSGYTTEQTPAGRLLKKPYRPSQLIGEIEALLPRRPASRPSDSKR